MPSTQTRERTLAKEIKAQLIAKRDAELDAQAETMARESIEREQRDRQWKQFQEASLAEAEKQFAEALALIPQVVPAAEVLRKIMVDFSAAMMAGNRSLEGLGYREIDPFAEAGLLEAYAAAAFRGQPLAMTLVNKNRVAGWLRAARRRTPE